MTNKPEHTAFTIEDGSESGHCCFEWSINDAQGNHVCEGWSGYKGFILRACNSHYDLLEAIEDRAVTAAINSGLGASEWRAFLTEKESEALAKARGEA